MQDESSAAHLLLGGTPGLQMLCALCTECFDVPVFLLDLLWMNKGRHIQRGHSDLSVQIQD
jgi:hypothetical protein